VQEIDEYRNRVSGFRVLEGDTSTEREIVSGPSSRIGETQIYAFVAEDGTPHVGTLKKIEPALRSFCDQVSSRPAVSLQIAELIGNAKEKQAARVRMRRIIERRSGPSTANAFYEGSVIRTELWDRLLANASGEDAAKRILNARSRLAAMIQPDGSISLELSAIDPSDYVGTTSAELQRDLFEKFGAIKPFRDESHDQSARPQRQASNETRDFFVSFSGADLAYAEAINSALRAAHFTTFYHPHDLGPGANIPVWMDKALMNSRQMLMLCSPEYMTDTAINSEAERFARFWRDARGAEFKLIPVELRQTKLPPLVSIYKRIDVKGMAPAEAGSAVITALKRPDGAKQRRALQIVEPLPEIFNVPYRQNPNFTGRFEAMDSLKKSLVEGNAAITAIAGLAGVGRTTLAAEYCYRFGGQYGGVWWVRAEQEPVLLADLATLGQKLGHAATGDIEADARAALGDIARRTDPWLLVYDNAPNADAVSKWLPAGSAHCLITSRFTGFDHVATVTRLDQWSDEVTADYLLARTGRENRADALRLARMIGGLPLAAEQAAVFLKNRNGITFDDYANEIARLIKEEKPAGAKGAYPDTVYAAFVKSLETLEGMNGGKTALDLLRLCAFLSPDGVDLRLLLNSKDAEIFPQDFLAAMANPFLREDALAALASLSLISQQFSPTGTAVIFHRLLLEVVRDWMGPIARDLWGGAAVQLIGEAFPRDPDTNLSQWPLCARLMPHITPLDANAPRVGEAGKALGLLLDRASLYLAARGDRGDALSLAEKAVAIEREVRPDQPLTWAAALGNLAVRYADLGRLDDAEAAYREALELKQLYLSRNDPSLAATLSNLAGVYWSRKEYSKAEELFFRSAEIVKAAHGPYSFEYGTLLSNLGALNSDWSDEPGFEPRRGQEEEYKASALAVTRAAVGIRHPNTATRHYNLGIMKAKRGDWAGAVAEVERAMAIMLSLDLAQHPNTQLMAGSLVDNWNIAGSTDKATRLQRGDISDLLPIIAQIEAEHRAWVAEDPKKRHFGPLAPKMYEGPGFASGENKVEELFETLAEARVDVDDTIEF
jgi:tetratricopeptide (TPR) repeat protein